MSAPTPVFIPKAFAQDAGGSFRNTIPLAPVTTQRASFNLGFPPLTMTPVASGGKPMLGPDVNGILYMLSTHTIYQQTGQPYRYSTDVVGALGGYAVGTLLGSTDGLTLWYNILAANTNDPDAGGAGWLAMFSYGITAIGGLIGGVRTLSPAEYARSVIVLSGALAANQQVVLPTQVKRWLVINGCTGAFSLTVKTAAGGGVAVPQGGFNAPVEVWGDGTNIYNVVAPVNLPIDQNATPLTIAQRTNAGYLLAVYLNQSSALENFSISALFAQTGADGFLRKISLANFAVQVALSQFAGQVTNGQVPLSAVMQYIGTILDNAALTGTPTAPTQSVGTNDASLATTAFVQNALGGGPAQSWQNMTGSRFLFTDYTNTTGRPITVAAGVSMGFPASVVAYVNGVRVTAAADGGSNFEDTVYFTVPPGAVYQVQTSGSLFSLYWAELF